MSWKVLKARFYKRGSQVGDKEYSYKFPNYLAHYIEPGQLVVVPVKSVHNEDGTFTFDTLACAIVTAVGGPELLDPEVEKHSCIVSVVSILSAGEIISEWQENMKRSEEEG